MQILQMLRSLCFYRANFTGGSGSSGTSEASGTFQVEAHGDQAGPTLSCSLTTYHAHSLAVTGNLAITTTNWTAGVKEEATYIIDYDTQYTLTIDGLSFPWLVDGWNLVKIAKIDGVSTVMGGMADTLGGFS